MELILYPLLSTRSRRSLLRTRGAWGKPVGYQGGRKPLLERLSRETGMSEKEVLAQLIKERKYLIAFQNGG